MTTKPKTQPKPPEDFLSTFGHDEAKETEGVWLKFAPGVEFKVASFQSKAYVAAIERERQKLAVMGRELTEDETNEAVTKAMASAILRGWRGVNRGGQPIDCTPEEALIVLTKSREAHNFVLISASKQSNYRLKAMEGDAGNS